MHKINRYRRPVLIRGFDGALENEFAELSETRPRSSDFAVFSPKCEKRRFDVRSLMVRRIIEQNIIGEAVPAEFAMLDHGFDALCAQFLAKEPPVVSVIGGQNSHLVDISFEHLLADLRIVRLCHRAM